MKPHRRCFFGLSFVLLALFWIGCGSQVPIQDISEAVFVPELVGTWHIMPEPGSEPGEMVVLNFNDREYYVELRAQADGSPEADTLRLRAYITRVNGMSFINTQYIDSMDEDERLFFFYTYALTPDGVLTLTELNNVGDRRIDKFETSEALYTFIRQNLHDEDLYGASMALVKVPG